MRVEVTRADDVDWQALDEMLRTAFASMNGRIDPPSSLHRLTVDDLRAKASEEALITASIEGVLRGCVFCRPEPPWLYIGKMAVAVDHQGEGIGRRLVDRAFGLARELDLDGLELETRIELTENHEAFARLGFVKIADQSHPGYGRVTSIRMRARFDACGKPTKSHDRAQPL